MLTSFVGWASQLQPEQITKGAQLRIIESEDSDNPSARLDIDTPTAVARITFWESGNYFAEVIDLNSENIQYSNHGHLSDSRLFDVSFASFLKILGSQKN
jgi:hypothetical protein